MEVEVKGIRWITIQLLFSKKWGKKKMEGLSASESPGVSAQVSSPIQVLTGPDPA